jgi:phenylpropionate dioxygenase-like ring-hydroxylating dioxygenase large terminal subunit
MNIVNPHRWNAKYPYLGTEPLPIEPYISPAYYEAEKEKIFKKVWLCVGRVEEVAKAGDYKVKRIHAADTSIIVTRGKDGTIRAFHNMCSHRGNTVVTETGEETFGGSKAAVMTCRFHGWVYGADGSLLQVPQENRFYDCFDKSKNGLTPVHCDVWEGFIFVCVAEKPPSSLQDYLGGYGEHFAGFPYHEMTYGFTYHTYLNCNWKIGHDAFIEAYHVDTIHAGSFPNVFSNGLEDVEFYGPHRTCGVALTLNAEPTPVAAMAHRFSRSSLVSQAGSSMLPTKINPQRKKDFSFELSCAFPNFLLHVAEGIWFTHIFWPVAHDKCFWEGRYYVREPKTHSERWAIEHSMILQRNAWLEDTATMEDTHRAMMSGAKKFQNVQDEEIMVRHGFYTVEKYVHA